MFEIKEFETLDYCEQIVSLEQENFLDDALTIAQLNEILPQDEQIILLCLKNEDVIGYIYAVTNDVNKSVDIMKIAVQSTFRKKGIGSLLLKQLEEKLSAKMTSQFEILLEVRASNNNAIQFYKNQKYIYIGKRKHFYKNPQEDAYIFQKNFRI